MTSCAFSGFIPVSPHILGLFPAKHALSPAEGTQRRQGSDQYYSFACFAFFPVTPPPLSSPATRGRMKVGADFLLCAFASLRETFRSDQRGGSAWVPPSNL